MKTIVHSVWLPSRAMPTPAASKRLLRMSSLWTGDPLPPVDHPATPGIEAHAPGLADDLTPPAMADALPSQETPASLPPGEVWAK